MKILLLSAAFHLDDLDFGGVATHVSTLARGISKYSKDLSVHVITLSKTADSNRTRKHGITVWELPRLAVPNFYGRRVALGESLDFIMKKWWADIKPDLIHAHDFDSVHLGWLLKVASKKKLVVTFHRAPTGWRQNQEQEDSKSCYMEAIRLFDLADGIIVPSKCSLESLAQQNFLPSSNKLKVIPHGISKKFRSYATKENIILDDLKLSSDSTLIMCPIRGDEHKDPVTFIRAAAILKQRIPEYNPIFLMSINQDDRNYDFLAGTAKLSGLNIDKDIKFRKYKYYDMPTIYRSAKICVIPSRRESFGQTVLEAFLFGVPVVVANTSALKEIVRHNENGLLFTDGVSTELAEEVEKIIRTPKLAKQLTATAKHDIETIYSVPTMIQQYENFYKSLCS